MITFKKHLVNKKWWGTWDVYKNSKKTGISILQTEQGKGDEFICLVDPESKYYFDFEPCVRKSLDAAKNYIKRSIDK